MTGQPEHVLVIGAGIVGSRIAYEAAGAGLEPVGVACLDVPDVCGSLLEGLGEGLPSSIWLHGSSAGVPLLDS